MTLGWTAFFNYLLCGKPAMYTAIHCQQYTAADVDRTDCAEDRYGSCCV